MQKERKAKNFLPKLVYPGGPKALAKFISDHLRYPSEAKKRKIEGTVRLKLDIDYKGSVKDATIMSGLGYGCDEEAKRLVSLLKWDINKKIRKGKILFHKTLNIHFKLPKALEKKKQSTQISYQIVGSSPTSAPKKKTSYQYTIKY